jgi:hypothetical protein
MKEVRNFLWSKMKGTTGSCRLRDPLYGSVKAETDVLNRLGRVGMEESVTGPSLALASCVTRPLVCVSTGADEVRDRGGPHQTFEA